MTRSSVIAAFDFDHTLTTRDSLLPFLFLLGGLGYGTGQISLLGPDYVRYLFSRLSRQEMKEKILTRFIKGKTWEDLRAVGEEFASHRLGRWINPKSLKALAWHQAMGHRCLLISASLELYLHPWARIHGFETVLASRLELTPSGQATGCLMGLNCWGPEKVRRLIEYAGSKEQYQLYAYGDSRGDQELLQLADYPFYRQFPVN